MNFMDLRALKDFYSVFLSFEEPIKCAECGCSIYLSEKEIKERCLYQTSDWTKCLCPSCTNEWVKSRKGGNK